ncbi:hypothetical protein HJA85_27005 [Rhizobium bangladeshense]|uniref:hypothetical protein n=1 Tax=Rhizobium bangladeshense TaxID=1138189 RepID=UPI001C829337|nr:hypothetical protein [Rhizobium bangladeshense]MBX4870574.1 hypothetical protein [Rhizobium bangladeshense]
MAYSVQYVPANVVEEMRGSHQLGVFLRIDTEPALHMWFGVNDVPIGFDGIDPDGTVYLGGGRLIGVPSLEVLVNGTSDAVDFSVSGIDPATGAAMLDSIPAVRGKMVQIGLTTLDQYYQPMSQIIPIWTGLASHPKESRPPIREGETATLSLSLAVVAGENTRSRPSKALWSDAMQRSLYPTDAFCNGTGRLARGIQPKWPVFS